MQTIVQGRMDKTLQGEQFSSFHPEMLQIARMMQQRGEFNMI